VEVEEVMEVVKEASKATTAENEKTTVALARRPLRSIFLS
jgi:hypothetical protein